MKRASTGTHTSKTCTSGSALVFLFAAAAFAADPGPRPPCGGDPSPSYRAVESPPVVKVWERAEWTPSSCTSWDAASGATLVATVGRFRFVGGVEGLRRRIGAVSEMKGLVYWSTTDRKWQPLILDAAALDGPAGPRRDDFALDETAPGHALYLEQHDNRFGKATYRMRILEAGADRLVFATDNTTPIRYLGMSLASAGSIQSICFLDREADDVWRYYALARTGKGASLLTAGHQASLINRAVAVFRHLAGIPPDREPPAAR